MPPSPVSRLTIALLSAAASTLVLSLLRVYKILLSPLFTGCCRFQPSCSEYMAEAVRTHGAWRGVLMGIRRLARCHPFGGHGFDPVHTSENQHVFRIDESTN